MKDTEFEKLSMHDKLSQIRANQKRSLLFEYFLWLMLVIQIAVGFYLVIK
jgi:hypothetical protein